MPKEQLTTKEMTVRLRDLEKQMAIVATAIELVARGLNDDATFEITKIT